MFCVGMKTVRALLDNRISGLNGCWLPGCQQTQPVYIDCVLTRSPKSIQGTQGKYVRDEGGGDITAHNLQHIWKSACPDMSQNYSSTSNTVKQRTL